MSIETELIKQTELQQRRREAMDINLTLDIGAHLSHLLKRLFPKHANGKPRLIFNQVEFVDGSRVQGDIMALTLTDVQKVTLTIEEDDAAGNPVPFTTVPVWGSSDESKLTVVADPADASGKTAIATAVGPLGSAQANVAVDGLNGTLDVTITNSAATSLNISAGTPTAK